MSATLPAFAKLNFTGTAQELVDAICVAFNLGKCNELGSNTYGYEDVNLKIQTSKGDYFVKIFTSSRDSEEVNRCIEVLERVAASKINHPKFILQANGRILGHLELGESSIYFCVMECIDAPNLMEQDSASKVLLIKLAREAALISQLYSKSENLDDIYDSWGPLNFAQEFEKRQFCLADDDLALLRPTLDFVGSVSFDEFPKCFCHADLRAANLLWTQDEELFVVDFSVGGIKPRLIELAVILGDTCFDYDIDRFKQNCQHFLEAYRSHVELTNKEVQNIPDFLNLFFAMFYMRAAYEIRENSDTFSETAELYNRAKHALENKYYEN